MREPNPRVRAREKFELSLDGRQVASIVVGALVVFAVVFVLGLNVGKQLALRQVEAGRAGDLEALDRAPVPPPAKAEPLTFHDRLTKESPPPAPEPAPRAAAPAPPAAPSAPAAPAPSPAAAVPPAAWAAPAAAAAAPAAPAVPPPAPAPAAKPWTIQLAASESRQEAERLASRYPSLGPRVEEAIVPGKGRFFRVRVGSFETREAAQHFLRDVGRETGAKGIVVSSR